MSHAYQLIKGMEPEASLDGAFAIAFQNEKYHDITLKGNDGVTVAADRIVLSLRSKYFENMLMGNFKETSSTTIEADYPGEVIKAVVEYIHTDTAHILVEDVEDNDGQISEAQMKEFQTLITLTEAAAYFNLPKLCKKVHSCMKIYLDAFHSLSIAVLEATSQEGPVISDNLLETSFTKISSDNFEMLKEDVLSELTSSALSLLLSKSRSRMYSQQRFELIRKWAGTNPDQLSTAKNMIQNYVELQWIDPDVLSSDINPTGLVTTVQLLEAFQHQAKRAKHEKNMSFHDPFVNPKWTHAKSNIVTNNTTEWKTDLLNISPLILGSKYRWTVKTKNPSVNGKAGWLGVAKSTTTVDLNRFGGYQDECWGIYGFSGAVYSSRKERSLDDDGAKFGGGSIVTLTLDLSREEPNNGSLSISVDEGAIILAESNMRDHVDGSSGFLPAVTCLDGSVTIEGIEIL